MAIITILILQMREQSQNSCLLIPKTWIKQQVPEFRLGYYPPLCVHVPSLEYPSLALVASLFFLPPLSLP